jgi:3-oxoacyl-[acyl-carrier protein] reductase
MTDLTGSVAIVTGASRGIGAAAAFVLAKAGAAVMLVPRDGKRASRLAKEIVASGGRAAALGCDVADYESVRTMVHETEQRLGSVDILVNNAGVIEPIGALCKAIRAPGGGASRSTSSAPITRRMRRCRECWRRARVR